MASIPFVDRIGIIWSISIMVGGSFSLESLTQLMLVLHFRMT